MIVLGCIEFHLKDCIWWIIVMRSRVLLVTHYLIWEILVGVVLDVHVRDVKIKKVYQSRCSNNASSTKRFHGEILVSVFLWDHGR